ncbi:hypothetical protein [Hydromonas duriensis]|uniref:Uncharacterized protein n=1 Tax=Hydromonas duriensis TaxID=1527608 RepID=A0A4V3DK69_9BURK|nr:hypothetical protein [Hydromonas duriensis]TDR32767.1 hypothetical protein DFR44_10263 [Hydromonas duriensis]
MGKASIEFPIVIGHTSHSFDPHFQNTLQSKNMIKRLTSLCIAIALTACQNVPSSQVSTKACTGQSSTAQAICLDPNWVLDAVVDGNDEKSKVMVVLTIDGIKALKAKADAMGNTPIALQVGFYTFESYNSQSLTSGFLVLKPFHNREEASYIVEELTHK